jgi:hypothetical protein
VIFAQQIHDGLPAVTKCGPYGSAPLVDGLITLETFGYREDLGRGHVAAIARKRDRGPLSLLAPHPHVDLLDLTSRKPSFNAKIEANQGEDDADRFAPVAGGLRGVRINHVLQDEAGTSHRLDVDFIVRLMHRIHVEPVYRKTPSRYAHPPTVVALLGAHPPRSPWPVRDCLRVSVVQTH